MPVASINAATFLEQRIVQECLNNVTQHAHAKRLRLVLARRQHGDSLRLLIRDDGVGMDVGAPHAGFGLAGMRERVLSLGGSLQIRSWHGAGTRVRVLLPSVEPPAKMAVGSRQGSIRP
ncbi:sensor histidine kinase [Candidatus Accumulibacter phosphatis]|uniref:histidine kinase n=1 Tax=Candidatus Accumulibacter phosphatis TaxID=327160 RepID=A0A5S4EIJ6_9PROT|nr:ATP-binding protein [Candidatus Accumulibacter phosphatis]TMQ75134.1 Sensory box histidine kinase [Candidatus Accumulibacter phosphatis]